MKVSISVRTLCAAPAASVNSRARPSSNGLSVCMAAPYGTSGPRASAAGFILDSQRRSRASYRARLLQGPMFEAVLPFPHIDPVLIHLGPLAIRWYALSYIAGLLVGWWYLLRLLRTRSLWRSPTFGGRPPATAGDNGDVVVWMTLGVILGGRLGFVLIYGTFFCGIWGTSPACAGLPLAYLTNPVKIIAAWEGGM